MNKNLKRVLKNPLWLIVLLNKKGFCLLNDEHFIRLRYRLQFNKKLDLNNPVTFNEKLQWLKLYDRNPEYSKMVDKYEVKKYISEKIGAKYIIPTLGVWEKFDDIEFNKLPNQFVLKCTHDSGSVYVCKDKKELDIKKIRKKFNKAMKNSLYNLYREWPYKNVKPRIIAEEYKEDKNGELLDYKVYAFNGKCEYVMTCIDRAKGDTKFLFYNRNWELQKNLTNDGLKYSDSIFLEKPENLNKMFNLASLLSKNIPFVRVDFYEVDGTLYFGELTFFPSGGLDINRRKETDEIFSNSLRIRKEVVK